MIVIEEPEGNLHAGAQRRLAEHLRTWARDRLFVISTHSAVLIDALGAEGDVWLVERADGTSSIRPIADEPQSALGVLGVRLSDVLSSDRILIVEGPSDAALLSVWLRDRLRELRVEVVPGYGGDRARSAGELGDLLDSVDTLGRQILFLRDRDELSESEVERLERGGRVHVLRVREIENLLLDPDAVAAVLVERADDDSLDPESVSVEMREIADGLKKLTILKQTVDRVSAIRFLRPIDRQAVRELADSGPELESLLTRVRDGLPSVDDLLRETEAAWHAAEEELDAVWDSEWKRLAPGADILEGLWSRHGLSFEKGRDGPLIAAEMSEPPEELLSVLSHFEVQRSETT